MTICVLLVLVLGSAAAAEKPSSDTWPTLRVLVEFMSRPENMATTGKGSQKLLFVEEKKSGVTARKQHNLAERTDREKLAAALIQQAVMQALMGGGTQATTKKEVKTASYRGFRTKLDRYSSKHRVYYPIVAGT